MYLLRALFIPASLVGLTPAGGLAGCKPAKSILFRPLCAALPHTTGGKKGLWGRLHFPHAPLRKFYYGSFLMYRSFFKTTDT
jgi:hypothetical protein